MTENLANLTFILGGSRSGKSTYAEQRALRFGKHVTYCATAEILDDEMKDRVIRHQNRRPKEWLTVEAPHNAAEKLSESMKNTQTDCVLLDCISILASNVLLSLDENIGEAEAYNALWEQELESLLKLAQEHPETHWLIVSNEVGMGVVPAYKLGRTYRDLLGRANQTIARAAAEVIFMIAGIPMELKKV